MMETMNKSNLFSVYYQIIKQDTMNKLNSILAIIILLAFFTACSSGGQKTESRDAQPVKDEVFNKTFRVSTTQSTLAWEGYKPAGKHDGTLSISKGSIDVKDEQIVGGIFTFDMRTIKVLDLEDPESNAKLAGHLASADFFDVAQFPTGVFEITSVRQIRESDFDEPKEKGAIKPTHVISGNLTLKGITKNISFNALIEISGQQLKAESKQFYLDRTDWNIRYGSKSFFDNLKDNFINDEMGITLKIVAEQKGSMAD